MTCALKKIPLICIRSLVSISISHSIGFCVALVKIFLLTRCNTCWNHKWPLLWIDFLLASKVIKHKLKLLLGRVLHHRQQQIKSVFKSSSVARLGVLELSPTTIGKTRFRDCYGLKIILYALSAAEAKTQQQQQGKTPFWRNAFLSCSQVSVCTNPCLAQAGFLWLVISLTALKRFVQPLLWSLLNLRICIKRYLLGTSDF